MELIRAFLGYVIGIRNANKTYIHVAHRTGRRDFSYIRAIIAKFPIETTKTHTNTLVCSIYRPPNANTAQSVKRYRETFHWITESESKL